MIQLKRLGAESPIHNTNAEIKKMTHDDIPITYILNAVESPEQCFAALRDNLPWERRSDAPRFECWMTDLAVPYSYGRGAGLRTYTPNPMPDYVKTVHDQIFRLVGWTFNCCFANGYVGPRDHLGWHADDSPEMDNSSPIAVVSFGIPRAIQFKKKDTPNNIFTVKLEPGSVLVMHPWMQTTHLHRIPKSDMYDPNAHRISLTFRNLVVEK